MRKHLPVSLAMTALFATAALAHHSPIVFDRTRQVTIEGTVTEFKWSNPHSWIHVDVKDEQGAVGNWSVEMNPASVLARTGWRSTTVKPGDKLSRSPSTRCATTRRAVSTCRSSCPTARQLGERPDGVL